MKRLLFVFMIMVIMAIVGLYAFVEFRVPEISFVNDSEVRSTAGNEMVIRRLYTSGVDVDQFYTDFENTLISAEFTDDEIIAAALASGTPEFYPAFYFNIYRPDATQDIFVFSNFIRQELAPGQTETNFNIKNVFLEMSSDNLIISDVDVTYADKDKEGSAVPVISEDELTMAINLDEAPAMSLNLTGKSGMITMQYTYDVVTNIVFPSTALKSQLLMLYANVSYTEEGALVVEYITEPYSSLEDLEY